VALVERPAFARFIAVVIAINAVTLGLETSENVMARAGTLLTVLDRTALAIFTVEIALRIAAHGLRFFRGGWNWFDFTLVAISLIPASGNLSVLRALRILRALRLLSVVPQMRQVVRALLAAVPGMLSVVAVLALVFYVSSVLATKLFGMSGDPDMQAWFGTIGRSMYTLFQVMTLESWSMGIVRPTMEVYPWAWVFFLPFIVITSFAVLNLFIALIVNAMQSRAEEDFAEEHRDRREVRDEAVAVLSAEIAALRREIAALRDGMGAAAGEPRRGAGDDGAPRPTEEPPG
jgi:voltage-gated sodium channel